MADDVNAVFACALENLVSVTEKSGNLRNDLRKVILESVSTLRKVFADVMNVLEEKGKTINVLECEVKKMETERVSFMKELSVRVQPTPPVGQTPKLYSDVARSREKGSNKKFKVVVKSKFNESAESVKAVLKSKINPIQMKVGIGAVRSFRDGRVVIESGSKNDIDIITNGINEACGSILEASVPKLRNPEMIVYNIPDDISIENARDVIIMQNFELNLHEEYLRPKLIFKNKRQIRNLVVEVSSQTRQKLLSNRLKIGWQLCNVDDYLVAKRCFKCSGYNHKAQECRGDLTCPLCAGDHKLSECKASTNEFKCINCINYNKRIKDNKVNERHSSFDKSCFCLQQLIRNYKQNIDY